MNADEILHADDVAGAATEDRVAAELARLSIEGVGVLRNRRMPRGAGIVDHLVVTPGAVWVVSTPGQSGRPQLRVEGRLARHRVEKLTVGGCDQTQLLDEMQAQIDRVEMRFPELPVRGALCFADADRTLFGGPFSVRGVDVVGPAKLAKLLLSTSAGSIDVASTASLLGHAFPAA